MFKQLENWVYFACWLWKSLSYNAIDNYITIKTLLHFCLYTKSFFKSKSMSILSRSDISSNQCKFMFAILLQLLLLFLYLCICLCYPYCGSKLYMSIKVESWKLMYSDDNSNAPVVYPNYHVTCSWNIKKTGQAIGILFNLSNHQTTVGP